MESGQVADSRIEADREKRLVALWSVLAAVLLTSLKLVTGLATGSLGILAEAAHSGLDMAAAAMTLWAVRVSGRPADPDHTYGHGKFENLSALGETLLLLVTCVWIVYESIHRLFFTAEVMVEANVWAFAVVAISIVVDFTRSRALSRAAKKHHSQALEADALHFSTDIWSSAVVFVGLLAVLAGEKLGAPWLVHADSLAALGVALIVIWVSFRLGKRAIDDLLDRVPRHLQEEVASVAAQVPGVEDVKQVRLRRSGAEVFADVTLAVDQATPFEKTHDIADRTEDAVRSVLPKADVVVHVEPVAAESDDLLTTIRLVASRHGLGAHGVRVYDESGRRSLELHLEVNEGLTLAEAHRQATGFEEEIREAVPDLAHVITHLEPAGSESSLVRAEAAGAAEIERAIREFLDQSNVVLKPHEIRVQRTGEELAVSFHCTLDAETDLTAAHELTEQLEKHLRARVPELGRVLIHVEPATGA